MGLEDSLNFNRYLMVKVFVVIFKDRTNNGLRIGTNNGRDNHNKIVKVPILVMTMILTVDSAVIRTILFL